MAKGCNLYKFSRNKKRDLRRNLKKKEKENAAQVSKT